MAATPKPLSDQKIKLYIGAAYALGLIAILLTLMSHFRMLPPLNLFPLRTHWITVEDESGNTKVQLTTLVRGSPLLLVTDDHGEVVISAGAGSAGHGQLTLGSGGGGSIRIDAGSPEIPPYIELRDQASGRLRLTLDDDGNPILVNPATGETKPVFNDPAEDG